MNNQEIKIRSGAGNILGIVYLLKLALDGLQFKEWLSKKRHIDADAHVLNGYLFGLRTLIRLLHSSIVYDSSLDLTEDFTFSRARFYGVPIAEVPNSCEKGILLRNINRMSRRLLNTKSWAQIAQNTKEFEEQIINPLEALNTEMSLRFPKLTPDFDFAISFAAQWNMHLFLHDTRRGYPHGYRQSMLDDRLSKERLEEAFEGYKLLVQYLWFKLLSGEFAKSVASRLHQARGWLDFDKFYRPIQHEQIDPKEKLVNLFGGFESLLLPNIDAKNKITDLLKATTKEQSLSLCKDLKRKFFWYPIELIHESNVFNGVAAFVSILNGTIVLKQREGITDPVMVMRVKHPAGGTINGRLKYDYSYGILMEAHTIISDYSGWLLFFDCCGDYSGFSGSEYMTAEGEIKLHLERKAIEVHEVDIEKEKFLECLHDNLLSTTKDEMQEALKTKTSFRAIENKIGAAKGLLLELLGSRHYYRNFSNDIQIEWSYERLDQEVDLIVKNKNKLTFVECKKPGISDPVNLAKTLKDKAMILRKSNEFIDDWNLNSNTEFYFEIIVWDYPPLDAVKAIEQLGVNVVILSKEAEKAGIGRLARQHLKVALDVEQKKPKISPEDFF